MPTSMLNCWQAASKEGKGLVMFLVSIKYKYARVASSLEGGDDIRGNQW
jgi:hypothetical protein